VHDIYRNGVQGEEGWSGQRGQRGSHQTGKVNLGRGGGLPEQGPRMGDWHLG
jgi:hypothetical protein